MSGYTKVFATMLDSTIWLEDSDTKVVWVTMLAMADRDGIVEASVPGLAKRAGVEITATERALEKFMSPDPHSRSPEFEGRRIEKVDGGWRLLNFDKYAYRLSDDDRREKGRERTRRWRERKSEGVTGRHTLSPSVTPVTSVTVTGCDGGDDTQTQTQTQTQPPFTPRSSDEPHPAPPEEPAFNPAFDGELHFNAFVDLFPEGKRDYSRFAQDEFFASMAEIRAARSDCSDQEAREWLMGRAREYLANANPERCKGSRSFLSSKPWRPGTTEPQKKRYRIKGTNEVIAEVTVA